jgi:hypothetical protein
MSQAILGQRIDGIWHTGIVVFGYEYFFGGGIQKLPWGAFAQSNQLQPVQVLGMDSTTKTMQELEAYLGSIHSRFTAMTYDLINNNCNNFADTVCRFLVGHGIPSHIVDLPRIVFSTPGGAMLRPMIEGMQANIRQQHGQGLDPFGGGGGAQLEQQLAGSVNSLLMNTMQQNQTVPQVVALKRAVLDEKPLLSMDSGTVHAMEKLLHNLAGPDGTKGSAMSEAEHSLLTSVVQRLVSSGLSFSSVPRAATNGQAADDSTATKFSIDEYLLFEKLLALHPKAQSPALFILRLMLLHDRTSDYSDISIVREIVRRLLNKPPPLAAAGAEIGSETSTGFASIPAHVMALCAISNLLAHEQGLSALYRLSADRNAMDAESIHVQADVNDSVLNDLVDVVLAGLSNERTEVRQMSVTLAYNLTLACTQNFVPSGPWKVPGNEAAELNSHALQLLCGCFEGIYNEKDANVRKRRLAIICRIARTFSSSVGSLMNDLGFADILQILKSDESLRPPILPEEKEILGELLHYCA